MCSEAVRRRHCRSPRHACNRLRRRRRHHRHRCEGAGRQVDRLGQDTRPDPGSHTRRRFTVTSNATNVFAFSIADYLPSDCIVDLKSGTATGVGTVANCGARGLSPRGAWDPAATYLPNDLVLFQQSSWRAKQNNKNKSPAASAADWEMFAAKGAAGARGAQGPPGADGGLAGKRVVTKSCGDSGGWASAGGYVHCIAACAAGEIPFGASNAQVMRGTNAGFTTVANFALDPAAQAPFPANVWYSDFYEPERTTPPNTGEGFKQVWVSIICGPAP